MKANARARTAAARDDGVSSVVSAVLVFTLFSTAFVLWSVTQLPAWVADREAQHQVAVRDELADLQAGLERLSAGDDQGPVTGHLPLAAPPIPLLGGVPQSGHLRVEDGAALAATFRDPHLHVVGDAAAGVPTAAPQTVAGVDTVRHLHLSLDSSGVTGADDAAWIEARVTDGARTLAARLVHGGSNVATDCAGRGILVRVTTDAGAREHTLLCEAGSALTDHTVDVLRDDFGLAGRLADLAPDHTLTVATGGSGNGRGDGTFLAVWSDGDGNTRVAGGGTPEPGYAVQRDGGRLLFDAARAEATPETLSWEFGAVVARQAGTGASGLAVEPDLRIASDGRTGLVRWTLTSLVGAGDVSGGGAGTVQVTHEQTHEVVLSVDGAGLALTTPAAAAWRNHLQAAVQAGGVPDASVEGTGDEARLVLTTDTLSEWVLHLRVVEARVAVR